MDLELEFHHNQVTQTYFRAKNVSKVFFFIYGLKDLVYTLIEQVS